MSVIAVGQGYSHSLQRYFIFSLIENNNPLFWAARPAFETFFAFCDKKSSKNICITKKCCTFASQLSIGLWCNGNTADSGPAFPGSSPGSPTQVKTTEYFSRLYFCHFASTHPYTLFRSHSPYSSTPCSARNPCCSSTLTTFPTHKRTGR